MGEGKEGEGGGGVPVGSPTLGLSLPYVCSNVLDTDDDCDCDCDCDNCDDDCNFEECDCDECDCDAVDPCIMLLLLLLLLVLLLLPLVVVVGCSGSSPSPSHRSPIVHSVLLALPATTYKQWVGG